MGIMVYTILCHNRKIYLYICHNIVMLKMKIIRFRPELIKKVVKGEKILTSRNRRYNGEYVIAYGSRYKPKRTGIIVRLRPLTEMLKVDIAERLYQEEGFHTEDQCLKALNELHPRKAFLWVHSVYPIRIPEEWKE